MRRLATPEFSEVPAWVQERVVPRKEREVLRVDSIVPREYAAYAKVFHPMYIDPSIQDEDLTWHETKGDDEKDGAAGGLLNGATLVRGHPGAGFEGVRIRWSELCEKLNVELHPEVNPGTFRFPKGSWPRYLVGPEEGSLDAQTCEALVELFRLHGEPKECSFFYSPFAVRKLAPLLLQGDLDEVLGTLALNEVLGTPTYWWPADRTWCVCSDWDLTFTFVAGSEELIQAVLAHPDIEALPIDLSARLNG